LQPAAAASLSLSYTGQQILPTGFMPGNPAALPNVALGGLSGIDPIGGARFIAISDDRSQVGPARFYTLSLKLDAKAFSGVTVDSATVLLDPAGKAYAPLQIDPESIRRLPNGNTLYTSEGDTSRGIDAFIREARPDGSFVRDLSLPPLFQQSHGGATGVRNNLAFESLTLMKDGTQVMTATENALLQDGPAAAPGVASTSRLLVFDLATGAAAAQHVYLVCPVPVAATPASAFSTNGLVELLHVGGTQFIAVERSYVTGRVRPFSSTGNSVQLYLIDTADATDVSAFSSLVGQRYAPVKKTLLFDLDSLQIPIDNIEGISFGPLLDNGARSLILVSDNNFSASQFTQFLAFQVQSLPATATATATATAAAPCPG